MTPPLSLSNVRRSFTSILACVASGRASRRENGIFITVNPNLNTTINQRQSTQYNPHYIVRTKYSACVSKLCTFSDISSLRSRNANRSKSGKYLHIFYNRKGETFMYIILKNQSCIFILSVLLAAKSMLAIPCALVGLLSEQNCGLLKTFLKIFPWKPHLKMGT